MKTSPKKKNQKKNQTKTKTNGKICHFLKDSDTVTDVSGGQTTKSYKNNGYFLWDVLLTIVQDCIKVARRELITKELILKTEYEG